MDPLASDWGVPRTGERGRGRGGLRPPLSTRAVRPSGGSGGGAGVGGLQPLRGITELDDEDEDNMHEHGGFLDDEEDEDSLNVLGRPSLDDTLSRYSYEEELTTLAAAAAIEEDEDEGEYYEGDSLEKSEYDDDLDELEGL